MFVLSIGYYTADFAWKADTASGYQSNLSTETIYKFTNC